LRFGPEENNTKSEVANGPASRDPADKLNKWCGDVLFFKQRLWGFLGGFQRFCIRGALVGVSEAGTAVYKSASD
jgi:hypothetical protein